MYDQEMAECRRRIDLGNSLNTLLNHNPDFRAVVSEGYLKREVLKYSVSINTDKRGTIEFLKGVASFSDYIKRVLAEAEQAHIDLRNYQTLIQDAR